MNGREVEVEYYDDGDDDDGKSIDWDALEEMLGAVNLDPNQQDHAIQDQAPKPDDSLSNESQWHAA